jgi:hypothetical protein
LPFFLGMYFRSSACARYGRSSSPFTPAIFSAGVDQRLPSTPAVLLPSFSVTRRTANTLALYEPASGRCRACALRRLPHCIAFTIRTSGAPWARRTLRTILPHLWACQWRTSLERASAHGKKLASITAVNVLLSFDAYTTPLVRRHQMEVGSLSSRVILHIACAQPLSASLQNAGAHWARLLHLPLPAALWPCLTVWFPLQESNRLTTFRVDTRVF